MKKALFLTLTAGLLMSGQVCAQASFDEWVSKATSAINQFSDSGASNTDNTTQTNTQKADNKKANQETKATGTNNNAAQAKNPVGAALKKLQFATGHGAAKNCADYYIYVYGSQTCGACRKLMPQIVKIYEEEIRTERKVELVYIALDKKPCQSRAYMDNARATFPGVWYKREGVSELPGGKNPRTIPSVIIVNKYGKVIESGDGKLVSNWKKHTIDK